MEQSKTCKTCGQIKPLDLFPIKADCIDGHAGFCKACKADKARKRKADNPDYYKRKAAETRKRHHLARMEYQREWRKNNPDAYRESARNLYWQDPEKFRERRRQYSLDNPEIDRINNRQRKARRKQTTTERYSTEMILELYGTDCHICGESIDLDAPRWTAQAGWERGLHLDHVIALANGGADVIENLRPAHGICNVRKQAD